MIDIVSFSYIRVEPLAYANLLANIEREDPPIATEGESGNVRPAQE
jgi:hypothetical protein